MSKLKFFGNLFVLAFLLLRWGAIIFSSYFISVTLSKYMQLTGLTAILFTFSLAFVIYFVLIFLSNTESINKKINEI